MSEKSLIQLWNNAWQRIIFAQLAPTVLLITTVALLQFGLHKASLETRWAAILILLASGILGAFAEFTAAHDAMKVAESLRRLKGLSQVSLGLIKTARWLPVVKYVTPAIFVAIFGFLLVALLKN